MSEQFPLPNSLHIVTYDVRGVMADTGLPKDCRQTGIVTQTHQLMGGLLMVRPDLQLSVTQTGAGANMDEQLVIPEGPTVHLQGIQSSFPEYLRDPVTGGKDKALVKRYYETGVNDPENPLYRSLAEQYAHTIRRGGSSNLLLQNANPTVGVLKAEELGMLDALTLGQLNVTGIIHDVEGYEGRLQYIINRLGDTKMNVKLVAVSEFVRRQLREMGAPAEQTSKVANGLDVAGFTAKLEKAQQQNTFEAIHERNGLPEDGDMVLVASRRVEHKGHLDIIEAFRMLRDSGKLGNMYAAFTGNNMLNTQALHFERVLRQAVTENGLDDKIFFLDTLTDEETAACYGAAFASVLPSTEPEGFAYANVKSMLAGTPTITTRLGGPLDYIQHNLTGLFVEPRDPAGIAEQLTRLGEDPDLYATLAEHGQQRAAEYTIESMVGGYIGAITAGRQRLPFRINPRSAFALAGEGMHSEVYRHEPPNGFVVQLFKEQHFLDDESLTNEYDYLREAYAAMPGLIPTQRLATKGSNQLTQAMLIKREVVTDPERNTLRKVGPQDIAPKTLQQLEQFVAITKDLFTSTPQNPAFQYVSSRVPDIIDPEFENLQIDTDDNLRLLDTNKLISTAHLSGLVETGAKLHIADKRIHALLLRRLMFIDAKFFGRTREQLKSDPFYAQYVAKSDFETLFAQSEAASERIA